MTRRPSFMSRRAMDRACAAFNADHPVGTRIRIYPGRVGGATEEVTVLHPAAHVLGGHTPVVQIDGGRGCIALTHVAGPAPAKQDA